ncbi:MAG TPA: pyridoxal-phosphate dependent enzyme [Bacteroidales bacterium]|nr:pyridoxal-phosphate dependent enzyme [Bacteroidales bacterium]
MLTPSFQDILEAHKRISPFIHRTPVLTSKMLNSIFGCELYLKCENFQKTGAFKFRGATNAVLSLTAEEKKKGVVTHSSGNHAAALALAARMNNINAHIVMPENAPIVKKAAVEGYGASITYCKPNQQAREGTVRIIIEEEGATLVHPYDNFNVICGQGTATVELLEEVKDLEIVMAPIGGGGLLSGTSTAARAMKKEIKIYGAEPLTVNDAYLSFKSGQIVPPTNNKTVADGLLTSFSPLTFEIVRTNVDQILTATEESIIECLLLVWERMKIVIEPSSAVVLAVIKENPDMFKGKKAGLIISGGNVDFRNLPFKVS